MEAAEKVAEGLVGMKNGNPLQAEGMAGIIYDAAPDGKSSLVARFFRKLFYDVVVGTLRVGEVSDRLSDMFLYAAAGS